jgi:hypothetical protein
MSAPISTKLAPMSKADRFIIDRVPRFFPSNNPDRFNNHVSVLHSSQPYGTFYLNMNPWSLVSPASRGIGFAIARELLRTTNAPVVATARRGLSETKANLLDGLNVPEDRLTVMKVNVLGECRAMTGRCSVLTCRHRGAYYY